MSEDRQYWPTGRRIAELRLQGLLPYSNLAALCAASITAIASGLMMAGVLKESGELWQKALVALESGTVSSVELWPVVWRLTLLPAVMIAAVVMVVGLLQNRFFFGFGELRFDLARIAPRLDALDPFRAFVRGGLAALMTAAIMAVGILVAAWSVRAIVPMLAADLERAGYWLQQVIQRVGVAAGVLLCAFAAMGVIGAQIRFRLRHRMTKAELERELREGA